MDVQQATRAGGSGVVDAEVRPTATVNFLDGEQISFLIEDGQTVLQAAKASGNAMLSQCEVGSCGSCVALLTHGEMEMPTDRPLAINAAEIGRGERLLCVSRTCGDVQLEVEYDSALLDENPAQMFIGKISRLERLSESVIELELKISKKLRFGFHAGQYSRIQVPGTSEWRSYSMASGEHERGRLRFLIRLLPGGAMSEFLSTSAKVGQTLDLEGPFGSFVVESAARPVVMLAGGTGLAPMLSMLDRLRLVTPTPRILLLFACTRAEDLFHLDELAARSALIPELTTRVALADNDGRPDIPIGNPVSLIRDGDIEDDTVAYLCGPPPMIAAAQLRLGELGLNPKDIRSERFQSSEK